MLPRSIRAVCRFTSRIAQRSRFPRSASGSTNGESSITARERIGRGSLIASNRPAGSDEKIARPCAPEKSALDRYSRARAMSCLRPSRA